MRKWSTQVSTVVVNVGRELSLLKMAINMANADYPSFFSMERTGAPLPTAGSGVPGVMLCGDFNARTGEVPDFVTHFGGSNGDLDNLLPPEENQTSSALDYLRDNGMLNRTSMDRKSVNKHGPQLIEFCKTTGMLILII